MLQKRLSFSLLFSFFSLLGFSQAVSCDLGLFNNAFKSTSGGSIDANNLSVGQVGRIQVALANFSSTDAPAGHFQVLIGLGSGLILNPGYDLSMAPLSNYFNWSYDVSGAQPQVIGTSIATLPANFTGLFYFEFKANSQTSSIVSFNFLINNPPGTSTPISDPNSGNNGAGNPYTVNGIILPVTFTGIAAAVKDCEVAVSWNVKTQLNLSHYEVEVSKDGIGFTKAAEAQVRNLENYSATIALTDALKAPMLYCRVKAVDKDGHIMYSSIATVRGQCKQNQKLSIVLYPNPVFSDFVTVKSSESLFNGKYKLSLVDKNGKVYQVKDMECNNLTQFRYALGNIAAGSYSLIMKGDGEANSAVVDFTKL